MFLNKKIKEQNDVKPITTVVYVGHEVLVYGY